ncbi:MAG: PepSY domain-containing protein [Alphaproteobacteria bacterium]|nr:PepSY domain-containing protein [Alphaproteobacteria bacterium]
MNATRKPHPLSRDTLALVWDVHTAAGVLAAPLLLVILVTATALPVHGTLMAWADPFVRAGAAGPGHAHVLDGVGAVPVDGIELHLPGEAGGLAERTVEATDGTEVVRWVDGSTGASVPERSHIVRDLYYLHFFYHLPKGAWLAGGVGLVLSLSLLTGVGVHLRDLLPQLGRLRRRPERARRADLHTLLGTVLSLPLAVVSVTGAMLCLGTVFAGAHVVTTFAGDRGAAAHELGYDWAIAEGAPTTAPLPDVDTLIARARAELPGLDPHWIKLSHPGADDAVAYVYGHLPGLARLGAQVDLSLTDDRVLRVAAPRTATPTATINRWGVALHFGDWGGLAVRLAYVLVAVGSVALTLYGVAVWRLRHPTGAFARGVEVATVVASAGLFAALSAALLSAQALPLDLPGRGPWQTGLLFAVWGLTVPVAARWPARRATAALLTAAAAWLAVAAAWSLLATAPGPAALLASGRVAMVVTDGVLLAVAAAAALGARQLGQEVTR